MSYIVFAWLASVVYALGSIVGKIAIRHQIANRWLYNFMWALLSTVLIVPFAVANHVGLPQDWGSMLWLGAANAVSGVAFILAFYEVDLTILSPLYNLRTPFIVLVGALFYREVLTSFQWVLMTILIIAGIFINTDEELSLKVLWHKGTLLAVVAVLTSVWFNSTIKMTSMHNGFWEVLLWSNLIATILFLPTLPLFYKDLKKVKLNKYYGLVISTILFAAGYFWEVKAFAQNVSISVAIITLPISMLIVIPLSVFKPKLLEKHTAKIYAIRLTAAAVMFAAALGLSR